jgi:hypothetical protein
LDNVGALLEVARFKAHAVDVVVGVDQHRRREVRQREVSPVAGEARIVVEQAARIGLRGVVAVGDPRLIAGVFPADRAAREEAVADGRVVQRRFERTGVVHHVEAGVGRVAELAVQEMHRLGGDG